MNIEMYRKRREQLQAEEPHYRQLCANCHQPGFSCYCERIKPFDPGIKFVILIHPLEVHRRIATGRMSHLCLKKSQLIMGHDYSENAAVNTILSDPAYRPVILYPGPQSTNLSEVPPPARGELFPDRKKLLVFVVDGTWATARKTMRLSHNLRTLPRICFTPPRPSNFRVRKQPRPYCYSTIEAIHHTIELLNEGRGEQQNPRAHDKLLDVFDHMVEKQLALIASKKQERHLRSRVWKK